MAASYTYYSYENVPCRIEADKGDHGLAEIYRRGTGFVAGPKMSILFEGRPISKAEFDTLVIAFARRSQTDA